MRPGTLLRWQALEQIFQNEIREGSLILDIGGCDGSLSSNLTKIVPGLMVSVADVDPISLQAAREKGLITLIAPATELPVEDRQFDIALCLDVIEHIDDDEKVIEQIARILKNDGKLILTTPMKNGISFPFLDDIQAESVNRGWGHIRSGYSLVDIKRLLEKHHIIVTKTDRYFNILSRFAYWFCFLSGVPTPGKEWIFRTVSKLEPSVKWGAQEHIIVGKKKTDNLE